jgi:small ligand-binding sensory domain FIST
LFSSTGFSQATEEEKACKEALYTALEKLDSPQKKDIACIIFLNPKYDIQKILRYFDGIDNVGISAEGVITQEEEFEGEKSGISLLLIDKRYLYCETFSVSVPWKYEREIGRKIGERFDTEIPSTLILFATPFYNIQEVLDGIRETTEKIKVVGGVASSPPGTPIFSFENGSIGSYVLSGIFIEGVEITTRIAKSCKPIGETLIVTSSYKNIIEEINGESAAEILDEMVVEGTVENPDYISLPWFVGDVVDEENELIRFYPILDSKDGAIYIGGEIEKGKVIKFGVMSKEFAEESSKTEFLSIPQDGDFGLFFNCVARGKRLFKKKNFDISIIKKKAKFPIAGFFGNGEITTTKFPTLLTYTGCFTIFKKVPIS